MAKITKTRTKERIDKNGEVFTPPELVKEILGKIKDTQPDLFSDENKTFCDPACGEGAFLVEVLRMKLEAEHDPLVALGTVYGVELEPENVEQCKAKLLHILQDEYNIMLDEEYYDAVHDNIVCSDAFKWNFEEWRAKTPNELKAK